MLNLDNLLTNEYFNKIKEVSFFENLENFHILIIFSGFLFLIIFIIFYFFLFKKTNKSISIDNKNKPTLNDIVNDTDKRTKLDNNHNDFIDVLVAIEEEMAAIRELYVGGYITKGIYISETDRLYEKAKVFGL